MVIRCSSFAENQNGSDVVAWLASKKSNAYAGAKTTTYSTGKNFS